MRIVLDYIRSLKLHFWSLQKFAKKAWNPYLHCLVSMHVALPKRLLNFFYQVRQSRQQSLLSKYIYCVPCWNIKINILTSCANEDQHIKVELMGGQGMLNLKSYHRFSFLKFLPFNRLILTWSSYEQIWANRPTD